MEKKEEAEKAWIEYFRSLGNNIVLKALPIDDLKANIASQVIHDFKLALKVEIDKKFVIAGIKRDYLTVTIAEILSLIDEVKPL